MVSDLSFSIYCLALAFEHYRQVNIVHSWLQDESLQDSRNQMEIIGGSLTCTRGDFPCTGDIQLTSRSEGRCTYLVSSLQMTLEKACSDSEIGEIPRHKRGSNLGPLAPEASARVSLITAGSLHMDLFNGI